MSKKYSTTREWLTQADFNWESGRIIYQEVEEKNLPGWSRPISSVEVPPNHEILDKKFDFGYGAPQCSRFIADDGKFLYFPSQYDGATELTVVSKDISLSRLARKSYPISWRLTVALGGTR